MQHSAAQQQAIDLRAERAQASFSGEELSCVYAGSREERDKRRWIVSILKADPTFSRSSKYYMGRTERV